MNRTRRREPKLCWVTGPETTYGGLSVGADFRLANEPDGQVMQKVEREQDLDPAEAKRQDDTRVIPVYPV